MCCTTSTSTRNYWWFACYWNLLLRMIQYPEWYSCGSCTCYNQYQNLSLLSGFQECLLLHRHFRIDEPLFAHCLCFATDRQQDYVSYQDPFLGFLQSLLHERHIQAQWVEYERQMKW